jgi:very-short-patch-repair endonuclease
VKLWSRLRDRRLGGHKFLRQVPIGPYIADFLCRERSLIVEVDGSGHARKDKDADRDHVLVTKGFSILRFWNPEVTAQIDNVCETILAALDGRLQPFERFLKAS